MVRPYVGMARKQNGGYNVSISIQMPIVHLVVNSIGIHKYVSSDSYSCYQCLFQN